MHRFNHHRRTSALYTILSGLFMSLAVAGFGISDAFAADWKVYAGNQCLPVDGETVNYTDISITTRSLQNDVPLLTGADQEIICPVIRDNPTDDIDTVQVSIVNDNVLAGMDDTKCCLVAWTFDGTDSESECDEVEGESEGQTNQVLSFEGPELDDDFDFGYYSLVCTLEATEEILGYRLEEN